LSLDSSILYYPATTKTTERVYIIVKNSFYGVGAYVYNLVPGPSKVRNGPACTLVGSLHPSGMCFCTSENPTQILESVYKVLML
jgi:hypothetical protein